MKTNNQQTCSERARAVDQWRIGLDKGGGSRAVDHLIGATPMADGAHSWTCAAPRKRLGSPGEATAGGRGAVGGYRAAVDGNTEVDGDTGVDGDRVVDDNTGEGDSTRFVFRAPKALAKFIAPKGSVALNGTSLTVNAVDGCDFGVNIIPHTKEVTTWGKSQVGDFVNLEIDTMARYVARLREFD